MSWSSLGLHMGRTQFLKGPVMNSLEWNRMKLRHASSASFWKISQLAFLPKLFKIIIYNDCLISNNNNSTERSV